MTTFYFPLFLILILFRMPVAVVLVLVVPIVLMRVSSDIGLAGFAFVACVAALGFAPLLRLSSEAMSWYIFLPGGIPIGAAITAAVVTCIARLLRTRF